MAVGASSIPKLFPSSAFRTSRKMCSDFDDQNSVLSDHGAIIVDKGEEKGLIIQSSFTVPKLNPILALPWTRRPIFPGFITAHIIKDEQTIEALMENQKNGVNYIGLFLRKDNVTEDFFDENLKPNGNVDRISNLNQIHHMGTFAQIHQITKTERGIQLALMIHRRIHVEQVKSFGPPTIVHVNHIGNSVVDVKSPVIKAYTNAVVTTLREIIRSNPLSQEHFQDWALRTDFNDPNKLADFAASITSADGSELQRVLDAVDIEDRLKITLELLNNEREIVRLQKELSSQVETKINKQHREYMLKEQVKMINKELGVEKDDKEELINKYKSLVAKFRTFVPASTLKVIEDEISKMASLDRNSPEFNVTRSYLDWLTSIPWGTYTKDELNIKKAAVILDEEHYGLEDIKTRILEFIAVGRLKGSVGGKIICFIGPPGVGKTSIAKSIAKTLNRKFYRFSVGGLTDIAEIKGHRRTYIGAMPGKPIQALKTVGSSNPIILIDEIDKIGKGYQGDPASALLELLDPSQNNSFVDHYLDVPVEFNNVLFVCTANDEGTIPGPLRDRMEIIRLSGYDIPEKVAIASKYLVPKSLKEVGLENVTNVKVNFGDNALETIIKNYSRESGVRSLEKQIDKIIRKIATKIVEKVELQEESVVEPELSTESVSTESVTDEDGSKGKTLAEAIQHVHLNEMLEFNITSDNLEQYIGKPKYPNETIYSSAAGGMPPGVVMGLAWNPLGGSPCYIEAAALPTAVSETGGGVNVVTGQLGSVMKESVNIAYTYARSFLNAKSPENDFFKRHQLHIHVPEGAVEKDGPSAGVAMATSLISIATATPLRPHIAMTGELSLTGKVLPVGGIKEKILAARRSGANTVILPAGNRRDADELPLYVKESVDIRFANEYEDAFNLAFQGMHAVSQSPQV